MCVYVGVLGVKGGQENISILTHIRGAVQNIFCFINSLKHHQSSAQAKKEKEEEFLISDNHTGAVLDAQLSPAYIFSSHLIPKPHPTHPSASLSFTTASTPYLLLSFSLRMLSPPARGGLDSVTHRSAGAAAAFRPSPHAVRPSGLRSISHIMRRWKDEKDKRLGVIQLGTGLGCRGYAWKTQLTGFKSQFSR